MSTDTIPKMSNIALNNTCDGHLSSLTSRIIVSGSKHYFRSQMYTTLKKNICYKLTVGPHEKGYRLGPGNSI